MDNLITQLSHYLGIDRTPTATIMVSVSVFVLGILINEGLKALGRLRERRAVREIVRRNYLHFKNYLFVQASNLETFSQHLAPDRRVNFHLYVNPCAALDSFRELSYASSFKAFFAGIGNFSLRGRIKRIQAFDNLYHSISTVRSDQERMFPWLAAVEKEVDGLFARWNASIKTAFEQAGDIHILLDKQPPSPSLAAWLAKREALYRDFIRSADPSSPASIRGYLYAVLAFERTELKPITQVMDIKPLMEYHLALQVAIQDSDALLGLVAEAKRYCAAIAERFRDNGRKLTGFYPSLFDQKLR